MREIFSSPSSLPDAHGKEPWTSAMDVGQGKLFLSLSFSLSILFLTQAISLSLSFSLSFMAIYFSLSSMATYFDLSKSVAVDEHTSGDDDQRTLRKMGPRLLAVKCRHLRRREHVWPRVFMAVKRWPLAMADSGTRFQRVPFIPMIVMVASVHDESGRIAQYTFRDKL